MTTHQELVDLAYRIEAAEAATEAINTVFASYHTEGGYAAAHIMPPKRMIAAMLLAPLGASLAFPWAIASRATGF